MAASKRRPGGARPDGPLLTREEILKTAVELTREVGLDGLSMRKLGDRLGVTSMAIYWYFRNKEELVAAITDAVLRLVEPPALEDGDWKHRIATAARRMHDVLVEYPGIGDELLAYQNFPPSAVPLLDRTMEILREAGFSAERSTMLVAILSSYVISRAHFEAYRRLAAGDSDTAREVRDRIVDGWRRLGDAVDPANAPYAAEYIDMFAKTETAENAFEEGLALLLSAMEAELETTLRTAPRSRGG
ncbi:MAG: hypothetical protein KatS3mg008_0766 [Acidimicrobiales bacterium]|nr:MAG: hypothetical protein KatS3mg008_0766 [Acidimicrobiales bacterium]